MFLATQINGLPVLINTIEGASTIACLSRVACGHSYPANPLLPHFVEHLLFCNTQHNPKLKKLIAEVENRGGIINGQTEHEATVFYTVLPNTNSLQGLETLIELTKAPESDPLTLKKEQEIVQEELLQMSYDDHLVMGLLIREMVWPGPGFTYTDLVDPAPRLEAITPNDIQDFHRMFYNRKHMVISMVGNINSLILWNFSAKIQSRLIKSSSGSGPGFARW